MRTRLCFNFNSFCILLASLDVVALETVVLDEESVSQVYCRSVALFCHMAWKYDLESGVYAINKLSESLSAQDCCLSAA